MKNEHGFSSTEALIATMITIILLAGAMISFSDSLFLNEKATQMADLEQNLRAGMNLMVQDFISAGWCIPIGGIPIPSGLGVSPVVRPGPADSEYYFSSQTIAAVNPGPILGPTINGRETDIVNILYADSQLILNENPLVDIGENGSTITVDPETPISGEGVDYPIRTGDLISISNAYGSTLQYVTDVEDQTISFGSSDPMNLNQPYASAGSIGQLENEGGGFPPTSATRVWLVTYYIDTLIDPNVPRLMRRINNRPGRAVALILQDLQLSYDLVDGDTNPTNVKIPVSPNGPGQIRKVNLLLSGRASAETRETGEFLYRNLTTQVSLRSLSYIDRYR
jgi:type II secretory pathway pseudopilin PulG